MCIMAQEEGEGLKEPPLIVYKDGDLTSAVSFSSTGDNRIAESGNVADKVNFLGNNGWCLCRFYFIIIYYYLSFIQFCSYSKFSVQS